MSFNRTFFQSLGQTLSAGIGAAHAAQGGAPPPAKKKGPACTPCAARALVAQAKVARR